AAHLVGKSGRVISLEPDLRLFSILLKNLTRNKADRATALPLALPARTVVTCHNLDTFRCLLGLSGPLAELREAGGRRRLTAPWRMVDAGITLWSTRSAKERNKAAPGTFAASRPSHMTSASPGPKRLVRRLVSTKQILSNW